MFNGTKKTASIWPLLTHRSGVVTWHVLINWVTELLEATSDAAIVCWGHGGQDHTRMACPLLHWTFPFKYPGQRLLNRELCFCRYLCWTDHGSSLEVPQGTPWKLTGGLSISGIVLQSCGALLGHGPPAWHCSQWHTLLYNTELKFLAYKEGPYVKTRQTCHYVEQVPTSKEFAGLNRSHSLPP